MTTYKYKPGDSVRPISEKNNSVWVVTEVASDRDQIVAEVEDQHLKPGEESRTAWGSSKCFAPVEKEDLAK